MNNLFKPYLRKFILVFFDDILVYSRDLDSHVQHLQQALWVLQENQLYVKMSKCSFAVNQVEYLGQRLEGIPWPDWLLQKVCKGLWGISKPLTELLKKNAFKWNSEAQQAFEDLKKSMVSAPVLQLPDYNQPFVVETDASQFGIGAVLMQNRKPIAYLSKKLGIRSQALSTYENELLALFTTVTKWKHYLLGSEFIIRTDQISLKYLLEQRINTPMQHRGLRKLLGLNYKIEYKKRAENQVADALSRREEQGEEEGKKGSELMAVTELIPRWVQEIRSSYIDDPWSEGLKKKVREGPEQAEDTKLSELQGVLYYKNRICVGGSGNWRQEILRELHASCLGCHSGIDATYQRVKNHFFWRG